MSSRNTRLNESQRKDAIVLYQSLQLAKRKLAEGIPMSSIRSEIKNNFELKQSVRIEYLELADASSLVLLEKATGNSILLIAGYVSEVRLIDNLLLDSNL